MEQTKKPVKKNVRTFQLIGKAKVGEKTFSEGETSKVKWNKIQLVVNCGKHGLIYCENSGMLLKDENPYVFATKQNISEGEDNRDKIFYDEKDTYNSEEKRPNMIFKASLKQNDKDIFEPQTFIFSYDAIEYISNNLKNDDIVIVTGNIDYQEYQGKIYQKKIIKNIYKTISITEEKDYKAEFEMSLLVTSNTIGKLDSEKKEISLYFEDMKYFGKPYNKQCMIPVTLKYDASDYNLKDKKDQERLANGLKFGFSPIKQGYMDEVFIIGQFFEGPEKKEVTYDDLTQDVQRCIDIGLMSLEQVISKSTVKGDRLSKMVYSMFVLDNVGDDENTSIKVKKNEAIMAETEIIHFEDLVSNEQTTGITGYQQETKTEDVKPIITADTIEDILGDGEIDFDDLFSSVQ